MLKNSHTSETPQLSRRERQIMDVLFADGECSARQIQQNLADAPSYSTVRALLAIMVEKQLVIFRQAGRQYLYQSVQDPKRASRSAIKHLINTFFQSSPVAAANALLGMQSGQLSDEQIQQLRALIDQLEKEQRNA